MGFGFDELKDIWTLCQWNVQGERFSRQLEIQEGRKDFISELGLFQMVIHVSGYFENPQETLALYNSYSADLRLNTEG